MSREYTPQVKNAAKLLDEVIPGWHWRVDEKKLEMSNCNMCMLGQTFGLKAEMGIAKELHPKEWEKAAREAAIVELECNTDYDGKPFKPSEGAIKATIKKIDGYTIGLGFFRNRAGGDLPKDLNRACEGDVDNCEWISEIADRRAQDVAAGKEPEVKSKRKSKGAK